VAEPQRRQPQAGRNIKVPYVHVNVRVNNLRTERKCLGRRGRDGKSAMLGLQERA